MSSPTPERYAEIVAADAVFTLAEINIALCKFALLDRRDLLALCEELAGDIVGTHPKLDLGPKTNEPHWSIWEKAYAIIAAKEQRGKEGT